MDDSQNRVFAVRFPVRYIRRVEEAGVESIPGIVLMYCSNILAQGVELTGGWRDTASCRVRLVCLPCSSKVELPHVLRILEHGALAVQVVGCPERQCGFAIGSLMAGKRIERGRELLAQAGLNVERLGMRTASALAETDLLEIARERADAVRAPCQGPAQGAPRR